MSSRHSLQGSGHIILSMVVVVQASQPIHVAIENKMHMKGYNLTICQGQSEPIWLQRIPKGCRSHVCRQAACSASCKLQPAVPGPAALPP